MKINYVGHSQGTTIMFAALSENQTITKYLNSFIALAPVVYLNHISGLLKKLANSKAGNFLKRLGFKQILPYQKQSNSIFSFLCKYLKIACEFSIQEISDKKGSKDNFKRFDVIFGHFPAGSSLNDILHYKQIYSKKKFEKFDYGEKINLMKYGQKYPPEYNLSNMKFPVFLFVGNLDEIANLDDVKFLIKNNLTECKSYYHQFDNYGHESFVWGTDNSHLNKIIEILNPGNNENI